MRTCSWTPPYTALGSGDFNGDGQADFVYSGITRSTPFRFALYVSANLGGGHYSQHLVGLPPQGYAVISTAVGDLNGDGKADIVTLEKTGNTSTADGVQVGVYLSNGDFTAKRVATLPLGSEYIFFGAGIAVGDFNGDGKLDIVANRAEADNKHSDVVLFKGRGDGTFLDPVIIGTPVPAPITRFAAADLRHSGKLDLVGIGGYLGDGAFVFLNHGDGTFAAPVVYDAGTVNVDVKVADLNGDGKPDLVVANATSGLVVLPGNGDGTFAAPQGFAVGGAQYAVNVGDLNGDGHPDLVVDHLTDGRTGDGTTVLLAVAPVGSTRVAVTTPASSVIPGRAQTFTATVARDPTIGGAFTGQVTFRDGSRTLGTASLVVANGVARATFTTTLGPGSHAITASYGGDASDRPSTSPALTAYVGDNLKQDFDGDGKADPAVYGKDPRTGKYDFRILTSSSGFTRTITFDNNGFGFGNAQSIPVPGDYFGDGRSAYALWTPNTSGGMTFTALSSVTGRSVTVNFGGTRDVPVVADVNGDGKADFGVYGNQPGFGYRFDFLLSSTGFNPNQQLIFNNNGFGYGNARSIPVVADFVGNGHADYGLFTPSGTGATFTYFDPATGSGLTRTIGTANDIPTAVESDGDGRADLALFGPDPGKAGHYRYLVLTSSSGFDPARAVFFDNNGYGYGNSASIPVMADYEGTGKSDFALFVADNRGGKEYVYQTSQVGAGVVLDFATNTDIPLTAPISWIVKKVRGS